MIAMTPKPCSASLHFHFPADVDDSNVASWPSCQAFLIAGLRGGFEDTRGTLFFEIVRILKYYKDSGNPIDCFILENVKGLLNHDRGRTFATIYGCFFISETSEPFLAFPDIS